METNEHIEIDIPCDVQQEDETGYVWAFVDEARDPSRIVEGAIAARATKGPGAGKGRLAD